MIKENKGTDQIICRAGKGAQGEFSCFRPLPEIIEAFLDGLVEKVIIKIVGKLEIKLQGRRPGRCRRSNRNSREWKDENEQEKETDPYCRHQIVDMLPVSIFSLDGLGQFGNGHGIAI